MDLSVLKKKREIETDKKVLKIDVICVALYWLWGVASLIIINCSLPFLSPRWQEILYIIKPVVNPFLTLSILAFEEKSMC